MMMHSSHLQQFDNAATTETLTILPSISRLRINTMLDDEADNENEIAFTEDVCIQISQFPTSCESTTLNLPTTSPTFCSPQPFINRSLSACSTEISSERSNNSSSREFSYSSPCTPTSQYCASSDYNPTKSSSRLLPSQKPSGPRSKRSSKIFTFDIDTSPTISKCPSYCNCWFHTSSIQQMPYIGPLLHMCMSFIPFQSKSHTSLKSSSSFSWSLATLLLLLICLVILLPSFLYIMVHSSVTFMPSPPAPHLSYPTNDPGTVPFSTYDRSDFQFDRMDMDDNWYFG
jgi:hypothetical protein